MITKNPKSAAKHSNFIAFAITFFVAASSFVVARYAWSNWTLYAIAITAFVLLGGMRFWPWGITRVRSIGVGLMLGLIASAGEFLWAAGVAH